MMIRGRQPFEIGDRVATEFSGATSVHEIVARWRARNCQSGILYRVTPPVPRSGGARARIDHDWFRRVSE